MGKFISRAKRTLMLPAFALVIFLSGCADLVVLDPQGPVAESQAELITFSIIMMLGIVAVVFVLFTYMLVKFRYRPEKEGNDNYDPTHHGNNKLEVIWTVIPLIIVTVLSIPTVTTIFELENPPEVSADTEPLVVHATTANYKWFFSYPEENIETVNYLHIPTDRAIEFKLSSADSMTALWIPALGGQKYNMAGMENTLYLQADNEGEYAGRNANYNGSGFAGHTFEVIAQNEDDYNAWVTEVQESAPELTEEAYVEMLTPGLAANSEYSSTHLDYVDHGTNEGREYIVDQHGGELGEKLHLQGGREIWDE